MHQSLNRFYANDATNLFTADVRRGTKVRRQVKMTCEANRKTIKFEETAKKCFCCGWSMSVPISEYLSFAILVKSLKSWSHIHLVFKNFTLELSFPDKRDATMLLVALNWLF